MANFVLLDSNILLRWVQPNLESYLLIRSAVQFLESRDTDLCYTSQNLGEFWNVCTRPSGSNGFGLSPRETDLRARRIEAAFLLLGDTPEIHMRWRRVIVQYGVTGVQVHDARLVASMLVHNVRRILTFNSRDFQRYAGIEALHPRDLSA